MELKLLSVTLLLTVVWLVSAKAANLPEQYWKAALPSTRMPKAIEDILSQTYTTNEDNTVDDTGSGVHPALTRGPVGASVGVGSGGVSVSHWNQEGKFWLRGSTLEIPKIII